MTNIQWTDETFNPIVGCTKVSPGCANCYAEAASKTGRLQQFKQYQGVVDDRGHWTGQVNFVPEVLAQIRKLRKPQRIFMPSMSDMFHPAVKDEWVDEIFRTIARCPHITFQVLTKRPDRMLAYFEGLDPEPAAMLPRLPSICAGIPWPLPNLWLGVSVENQKAADDRIPLLLKTPAVVRFLSCEPLLEAVDISQWLYPVARRVSGRGYLNGNALAGTNPSAQVNWIIAGGESGHGARPCNVEWIRSLVTQCQSANVPIFVKQLGTRSAELATITSFDDIERPSTGFIPTPGIRDRKGGNIDEWPQDLRVREFPRVEVAA